MGPPYKDDPLPKLEAPGNAYDASRSRPNFTFPSGNTA
jgi:hypothetical protein